MKTIIKSKSAEYWMTAIILATAKLVLHFLTNTNYELHRDEMLYFNMSEYLSSGYATVPPVIGIVAYIIKSIFGYSVFGIRLIPALLGAASVLIIAKVVRELGGGILALIIASFAFILSPGFLLFDTLFTPNVIEQFLWLVITYFILRMIAQNNPKYWIIIGILVGLSFLTKYSIVFYLAGFFFAILFSSYRKLINSRYFYLSILIGIIIILPNIIWQYNHGWPVVLHMKQLRGNQLDHLTYADFITDLFTLNSALTLIWISGLITFLFIKQEKKYQYIGVASLLILLLFLFAGGKGYYVLGIIPFLFAAGGYAIEKYIKGRSEVIASILLISTALFSLLSLPYGIPILSFAKLNKYNEKTGKWISYPFSRWEDGKIHPISQVYSDMTGWQELTGYVEKAYSQLSTDDQKRCTIFAEGNYGAAGAIHFYGRKYSLPEPITFSESYVIWAPDNIPEGPIIYINRQIGGNINLFNHITEIGCVGDSYFRENGLKVFLCSDPKMDVAEVYRLKAIEEKKIYE
jgi:hypothetical protein